MNIQKAMKWIAQEKVLLIFLIPNILLIAGLFGTFNSKFPDINISNISGYYKEFILPQLYNDALINQIPIDYPGVQMSPSDFRYRYILVKEKNDLNNGKYDLLFFAEKRISELITWGDKLSVKKNELVEIRSAVFNQEHERVIGLLKAWWDRQSIKDYGSWEATFVRYVKLMEQQISLFTTKDKIYFRTDPKEIILLVSRLKNHHLDLKAGIEKTAKSSAEKEYLSMMNDSIDYYLSKKVTSLIPPFNPRIVYFQMSDLLREKEYGTYNILVGNIQNPTVFNANIPLQLWGNTYQPNYRNDLENEIVYKNINISEINKSPSYFNDLSLEFPTSNLGEKPIWVKQKFLKGYFADFYNNQSANKYYFKFYSLIKPPATLRVKRIYSKDIPVDERAEGEALLEQPLKADTETSLETIFQAGPANRDTSVFRLFLDSPEPILPKDLASISVELIQIHEPIVQFIKIASPLTRVSNISSIKLDPHTYRMNFKNTTYTEESFALSTIGSNWLVTEDGSWKSTGVATRAITFIYRPYYVLLKLWIGFNLLLVLYTLFRILKKTYKKNGSTFLKYMSSFTISIRKSLSHFKYVLMLIFLIGIVGDIFFITPYSDSISLFLILIWITILVSFRFESRVSFTIALVLLIVFSFLHLGLNAYFAEKLAIWAFIFLIVGCCELIVEQNDYHWTLHYPRISLIYKPIISFSIFIFVSLKKFIKRFVTSSIRIGANIINRLFIHNPKNFFDFFANFIKFVILSYVIIILSLVLIHASKYAGKFIYLKIRTYQEKQARLALQLEVKKIEPRIVYHGTKVIIFGYNFGPNKNNSVKLMKGDGLVDIDAWSDTKIIFSVPLHWKPGIITLRLEKNDGEKDTSGKNKSLGMQLKLLPTAEHFTPDDDVYFQQLRSISDETLKINGYRPSDYK